jgi:hypothetical protein
MPNINVEKETSKSPSEAYQVVKEFLSDDAGLRGIDPQYTCSFNDEAKTGKIDGLRFSAEVTVVEAGSGSKVSIDVELPIMLTPFAGKVRSMIERKLERLEG